MTLLAGIDIGGTKCAVVIADVEGDVIQIIDRHSFHTEGKPVDVINRLGDLLQNLLIELGYRRVDAIGISCGGPLDSGKGIILSPPNLPGWDKVDIVNILRARFATPIALQNDANACA